MHRILKRLKRDHVNLLRLLELLERQLDDFHAGGEPDYELMVEIIDYIENYSDLIHHPTEERLFDALMRYDHDEGEVVDELRAQHRALIGMTKTFMQSLEGVMHETVLLRDDLEAWGRDYLELQRRHLELEEKAVFPLFETLFGEEDWKRIEQEIPDTEDPLFAEPDNSRFRSLSAILKAGAN